MSGPFLPPRAAQPLDMLVDAAGSIGLEELEKVLGPQTGRASLQPDDELAIFMFGLYQVPQGRQMFEWLIDITIRQPLRITGKTFEETALLAAGRQVQNGMGEVILKAIAHGEDLAQGRRTQIGAGS